MLLLVVFIIPLSFAGELTGKTRDLAYNYDPPINDVPSGYNYPIPINPPLYDESSITPQYPNDDQYNPYLPPPPYPPLQSTDDTVIINNPQDHNQYLPPPTLYGVPNTNKNPIQLRLFNMSCLDVSNRRFFRSAIRTSQFVEIPPVIDNARSDCVSGSGDTFNIDLRGNQMNECGVRYCSGGEQVNLCVPLRLPTVRGLRLPEDTLITLQCRPQERIASHTKHFHINPQLIQGRSTGIVASGGMQRHFETQIGLYRRAPGNNEFTQIVSPGSAVQLGEDLMLRTAVRDGDGWKYSRIGTVTMERGASSRGSSSRTSQDSITLVDSLGCRVSSMRSICPEHPRQVSPLITTFPFRAFMFQGANSGDEMVLSVRMLGCLQYDDCFQTRSCEEKVQTKTRTKRNTNMINESRTNWQSYLEFKVVLPELIQSQKGISTEKYTFKRVVSIFTGSTVSILIIILLIFFMLRRK